MSGRRGAARKSHGVSRFTRRSRAQSVLALRTRGRRLCARALARVLVLARVRVRALACRFRIVLSPFLRGCGAAHDTTCACPTGATRERGLAYPEPRRRIHATRSCRSSRSSSRLPFSLTSFSRPPRYLGTGAPTRGLARVAPATAAAAFLVVHLVAASHQGPLHAVPLVLSFPSRSRQPRLRRPSVMPNGAAPSRPGGILSSSRLAPAPPSF